MGTRESFNSLLPRSYPVSCQGKHKSLSLFPWQLIGQLDKDPIINRILTSSNFIRFSRIIDYCLRESLKGRATRNEYILKEYVKSI